MAIWYLLYRALISNRPGLQGALTPVLALGPMSTLLQHSGHDAGAPASARILVAYTSLFGGSLTSDYHLLGRKKGRLATGL